MTINAASYGDFELVYHDLGAGPAILLVPGHTMSAQRWVDVGYVDAVSRSRRVLVMDPLGHGESSSSADVGAYANDELVAHIGAVLDDARVDRVDLWGYSRGALMSDQFALAHPDRVRSVVYGGNVLFDPTPILASLGMLPDEDTVRERHDRSMAGDWSGYWDGFPLPLPDSVKRDIEARNDLPSIAASALATQLDRATFIQPNGVEVFAYWGTDEIFHDLNVTTAGELDIRFGTVAGGHAQAFDPAAPSLELVSDFLAGLD